MKCFLHKHKEPSTIPKTHAKKLDVVPQLVMPALRRRRCHLSYLLSFSPAKDPVSKVKVMGPGVKNMRLSLAYTQVLPCPNCQQDHGIMFFILKVSV